MILGHEQQRENLRQALQKGLLPHALLFSGEEGIGKKRVALECARLLHCKGGADKPCETHPDHHRIEPEGKSIKIEALRKLKQKIFLHPLEGEVKTVLIDDAHLMTEACANALLKILEEPPQDTYFFLVTSRLAKILPTIRSRCRHLSFSPLPSPLIAQRLREEGISPAEADEGALHSEGSLKRALEFDGAQFQRIQNQIEALQKNPDPKVILEACEGIEGEEEDTAFLFASLSRLWHGKIMEEKEPAALENHLQQWQAIQQAARDLEGNANKQLLLENLLFALSAP